MANDHKIRGEGEKDKGGWAVRRQDRAEKPAGYPKEPAGIEVRGSKVKGAGLVKDERGRLTVPERHSR